MPTYFLISIMYLFSMSYNSFDLFHGGGGGGETSTLFSFRKFLILMKFLIKVLVKENKY